MTLTLRRGEYSGVTASIVKKNKNTYSMRCEKHYENDDICVHTGDRFTVPHQDIPEDPIQEELVETFMKLKGLMLKQEAKKDPDKFKREVNKVLNSVEW